MVIRIVCEICTTYLSTKTQLWALTFSTIATARHIPSATHIPRGSKCLAKFLIFSTKSHLNSELRGRLLHIPRHVIVKSPFSEQIRDTRSTVSMILNLVS